MVRKMKKRICLVLDCLCAHDFSDKTADLINLQHYVIKEKRLSERETVVIFYDVVRVVEALHKVQSPCSLCRCLGRVSSQISILDFIKFHPISNRRITKDGCLSSLPLTQSFANIKLCTGVHVLSCSRASPLSSAVYWWYSRAGQGERAVGLDANQVNSRTINLKKRLSVFEAGQIEETLQSISPGSNINHT